MRATVWVRAAAGRPPAPVVAVGCFLPVRDERAQEGAAHMTGGQTHLGLTRKPFGGSSSIAMCVGFGPTDAQREFKRRVRHTGGD
jgi:hypothetical protein